MVLIWIALVVIVGGVDVKKAIRSHNYKEVALFSVLAVIAIVTGIYVQLHPAQISLATPVLKLFHLE